DLIGAVDQDIADERIAQECLKRAEAEYLIEQIANEVIALGQRKWNRFEGQHGPDEADHLLARGLGRHAVQVLEVQALEHAFVVVALDLLKVDFGGEGHKNLARSS